MELGFLDDTAPELLTSAHFPSKVGGHPAWLDPNHVPGPEAFACTTCEQPMAFLLQVYTGGMWEHSEAFHRTLFVFCCRNYKCHRPGRVGGFKVFRNMLPQVNRFYDPDPPSDGESDKSDESDDDEPGIVEVDVEREREAEERRRQAAAARAHANVLAREAPCLDFCVLCGLVGSKRCSQCRTAVYCCKQHQTLHWRNGHKAECSARRSGPAVVPPGVWPYPEFELITELEEDTRPSSKSDAERLAEFESIAQELKAREGELDEDKLDDVIKVDPPLLRFQEAIAGEPAQVLRYHLGGKPLWIGDRAPTPGEVPDCPYCGAPRQFECQVMPQLINDLETSDPQLEWGVLAIFSCSKSCSGDRAYKEEVIWHNPVNS